MLQRIFFEICVINKHFPRESPHHAKVELIPFFSFLVEAQTCQPSPPPPPPFQRKRRIFPNHPRGKIPCESSFGRAAVKEEESFDAGLNGEAIKGTKVRRVPRWRPGGRAGARSINSARASSSSSSPVECLYEPTAAANEDAAARCRPFSLLFPFFHSPSFFHVRRGVSSDPKPVVPYEPERWQSAWYK